MFYRTPVHDESPIREFEPLHIGNMKYLKITNEGLTFKEYLDESKIVFLFNSFDEITKHMTRSSKMIKRNAPNHCYVP